MKLADVLKIITPLPHMVVPTPPGADAEFLRIMGDDVELGGSWEAAIETKGVTDTPLPQKANAAYWAHAATVLPELVKSCAELKSLFDSLPLRLKLQIVRPDNRHIIDNANDALARAEEVEVLP